MKMMGVVFISLLLLGSMRAQQQLLAPQQLLSIQHSWWEAGESTSDCLEVEQHGSYQYEHGNAYTYTGKLYRPQIHAGTFTDEEMKQLRAVLEDPALEQLTTPRSGTAFLATDMWLISIARGEQSQRLSFASGKTSGTPVGGTPAMKPLMNWYKQVSKRKDPIDKTAAPKCSFKPVPMPLLLDSRRAQP